MTSPEIWAALAGIVSVVALVLEHLSRRTPARQVSEQLEEHTNRITALETTIAHWKNSP